MSLGVPGECWHLQFANYLNYFPLEMFQLKNRLTMESHSIQRIKLYGIMHIYIYESRILTFSM